MNKNMSTNIIQRSGHSLCIHISENLIIRFTITTYIFLFEYVEMYTTFSLSDSQNQFPGSWTNSNKILARVHAKVLCNDTAYFSKMKII